MSSPDYVEQRGLLGNIVAAKAQLYRKPKYRSILFFLQALSMQEGGLARVADEILTTFSDRIVDTDNSRDVLTPDQQRDEFYLYLNPSAHRQEFGSLLVRWFTEFLEALCIDPNADLERIAETKIGETGTSNAARYFKDPIGAILEYRKRYEAADNFKVVTSIGAEVHALCDGALRSRRMAVAEGVSGSGKTYAAKQWARRHLGEARYVSLSGITHRTGFFRKVGAALGLGVCQQSSAKLQARVEAHLERTGLLLIIDEAHYLWPKNKRANSAPELIDWVDTELVNNGVPVVLFCTDQFAKKKAQVEKNTGWNSDQMMHRTWVYHTLPERPREKDLRDVARLLLSHRFEGEDEIWVYDAAIQPHSKGVELATLYASSNLLPLGSLRSLVDHARNIASADGREVVGLRDIQQAKQAQHTSDVAIRTAFAESRRRGPAPSILTLEKTGDDGREAATDVQHSDRSGRNARAEREIAAAL
jgi:hypothetical protein